MSGVVRLFVYGTLSRNGNTPEAERFHQEADFLELGSIPGKLFRIGDYPGAMYDTANRADRIEGEIWRMKDPVATLAWLDEYEGSSSQDPEPHEFIRRIIPVSPEDGYHLACHAYLYNWFVDGRPQIPEGLWKG
ncbi:MAG TPA: gamma-glutamylcyclotransferase [Cytophagales bacterium]|nr:gamma-glutamylcyclotransferase [Cytophagales bacterium]HAA19482.1 gamma-glutamylcyclotransferase [Cytophagales bacterium]HAP59644.1 gamma-glutamylcyclotransferase [Cytophagales bacterium]